MSQLQKLRKWADYKGLEIETSNRDGTWFMRVVLQAPVKFTAQSGWEPTPDAAATKVIEQLEQVGEELDVV